MALLPCADHGGGESGIHFPLTVRSGGPAKRCEGRRGGGKGDEGQTEGEHGLRRHIALRRLPAPQTAQRDAEYETGILPLKGTELRLPAEIVI
jgi:hypothetical protein